MNRIIGGKRYNTETAREIIRDIPGGIDVDYVALYQKRTGEYFLYKIGVEGEEITPITEADAVRWVKSFGNEEAERLLTSASVEGKTQVCLSLDSRTYAQLKALARGKKISASELVARLIEHYASTPQGDDYII